MENNIDIDVYEVRQLAESLNEIVQLISIQRNNLSRISDIMDNAMISNSSIIYNQISDAIKEEMCDAEKSVSSISNFLVKTAERVKKAEEQIGKTL